MVRTVTGGCQCGQVRYSFLGALPVAYACHCADCRKQSASAFGISVPIAAQRLSFRGEMAVYTTKAFNGGSKACHFCPACGTRLMHRSGPDSALVTLKGGTLDDAAALEIAGHIWTSLKLPWVGVPDGVLSFESQPADFSLWREGLNV